ncbi:hypothetical protein [Streptomyces sp. HNM0574]|uniref:hypothetical protein n=1 Tax=Streptomyces sp. HNM0574 TaxID=2714954 RepID=UPI00146BAA36|nr:hypothetical protein [Streptomyces sp. HNM0574]NLU70147.1 hypothetical protein [Streptomyces sp. HNM0574]
MSETQTDTPDEQPRSGKHRGPAATSEETEAATRGRHRRPAQDTGQVSGAA